jgi:hypothetical protein
LLYTAVAESCPGDDGSVTAKDSNSHNLNSESNLENMLGCNDFLPLEDDSVDKLTHDDGTSSPFLPASLIYAHAC